MYGYLAIDAPMRHANGQLGEPHLHGGYHPTVFKTLRNAFRAAGPQGAVLILDLQRLAIVQIAGLSEKDQAALRKSWAREMKYNHGNWDPVAREWIEADDSVIADKLAKAMSRVSHDLDIEQMGVDDVFIQQQIAERQMLIWQERLEKLTHRMRREGGG